MYYTIGQRQGLGIGGIREEGWRAVVCCRQGSGEECTDSRAGNRHSDLFRSSLVATDLSWISGQPPHLQLGFLAGKIRYRQLDAPCAIVRMDSHECEIEVPSRGVGGGARTISRGLREQGMPMEEAYYVIS